MKYTSPGLGRLFRLRRFRRPTFPAFLFSTFNFSRTCCENRIDVSRKQRFHVRHWSQLTFTCSDYFNPRHCLPSPSSQLSDSDDTILNYNRKIYGLGRLGKLDEARQVFAEMLKKDAVSYGTMITMYLKHNLLNEAEELFYRMPQRNIVVDSAMVHAYAKADRIDEARTIFDSMPERNVFTWTGLISGYFQNGRVNEACQLFHQMPEKNVISWTNVLVGYARNGYINNARATFDQMPAKNVISWTAMIRAYVENSQVDEALKLFQQMPQRNIYSWNVMIQGLLLDKRVDVALELFDIMPSNNAVSWTTLVTGLAANGLIQLARKYFDQMPNKDEASWNAMITAYAIEGLMLEAVKLFHLMPKRNLVTYHAMIDGFTNNGPVDEAFGYLIVMLRNHIRPNETILTSIVTSCESTLKLSQAHGLLVRFGFQRETQLTNALVTMYSKSGDFTSAQTAFKYLQVKDTVSWTAMILAYSNHGYGNAALLTFARMLRSGSMPDEISFVGVLTACSHSGLVKKGQKVFNSMRAFDLVPKAEHYSCLVDMLGRSGEVNEAGRVVLEMPAEERDGVVLGALLSACRLHEDVELLNQIGDLVMNIEPDRSGAYVLLANSYAAKGKWDDFARVRKKMRDRTVKKIAGYSQIEINGKNHVFVVGDKSHPDVKQIYSFLQKKLLPLMQKMSYINVTSMALA